MSRTTKQSKQSEMPLPSCHEPGTRITVVSNDGERLVRGRVVSRTRGVGCHIREATPDWIPMTKEIVFVADKEFITKEVIK